MTGVENHDPEYVAARRVLLDALEALGPHRKAVVLVGAQAIYLHVGEGDMAVAPFTTDGDLAINPSVLAVNAGDLDDDAEEPPVPAGLAERTAAQEAMIEFLRIDLDLVAAAASASVAATEDGAPFRRWLAALSSKQKDAWLKRAADEPDLALGGELLRAFRATTKGERAGARRTVGALRALAEAQRAEREKAEAARARKAKAAADATRQRHLTKLGRDVNGTWAKLEKLVEATGMTSCSRRRSVNASGTSTTTPTTSFWS